MESPASARDLFQTYLGKSTDSALTPEVKFAVARSFEKESNWIAAITNHDSWVTPIRIIQRFRRWNFPELWPIINLVLRPMPFAFYKFPGEVSDQ